MENAEKDTNENSEEKIKTKITYFIGCNRQFVFILIRNSYSGRKMF